MVAATPNSPGIPDSSSHAPEPEAECTGRLDCPVHFVQPVKPAPPYPPATYRCANPSHRNAHGEHVGVCNAVPAPWPPSGNDRTAWHSRYHTGPLANCGVCTIPPAVPATAPRGVLTREEYARCLGAMVDPTWHLTVWYRAMLIAHDDALRVACVDARVGRERLALKYDELHDQRFAEARKADTLREALAGAKRWNDVRDCTLEDARDERDDARNERDAANTAQEAAVAEIAALRADVKRLNADCPACDEVVQKRGFAMARAHKAEARVAELTEFLEAAWHADCGCFGKDLSDEIALVLEVGLVP